MSYGFAESTVEDAALSWFVALGYTVLNGPTIAPGEMLSQRDAYTEVILKHRFREVLERLNPKIPAEALDEAVRRVTTTDSPSLIANNRNFHDMLVNGVEVEYTRKDGTIAGDRAVLFDFANPDNNDFTAVNQFTVVDGQHKRRMDIVAFVNGLPIGVIELKSASDENATIWNAYNQLQTYKHEIPLLFAYNELLVLSDGINARIGSLTANKERFMPWRTIDGEDLAPPTVTQLQVVVEGAFHKNRLLDLARNFVAFDDAGKGDVFKILAGYHQFHAVNKALESATRASAVKGDRRAGVIWHTQGSGKSLSMLFLAGKLILSDELDNPTIVVLTDRNDLDDQLFGTFARCSEVVRQTPVQAGSSEELRALLSVSSGGVVFTTVQKFMSEDERGQHPLLSDRRNIVVIADEAHRSQYDFIDGYARRMREALPNASFIGFTGTPIEFSDKNTRAVFGDYISVYDIQRAVEDGATVPIFYESRLAKLQLDEKERPKLDSDFEEATEGEERDHKEKLKTKWAALEKLVGAEKRMRLIAQDIVSHYEKRVEALDGKAMIVCMSRRICVELYKEIIKLRPSWHSEDDKGGILKVIMTGSASDEVDWQQHIRNKPRREALANRFKDAKDSFKIVLVRDMWLTGFDAPSLHTMYIDKPMRGHGLMQAIARVNRVFKDKPGGLVVDYLGLAHELKKALSTYTESGGKGETALDQNEAIAVMQEKYEICCGLFHGFDRSRWNGTAAEKLTLLPAAQEHILKQEKGKDRLLLAVTELSKAFALAVPSDEALAIRDDVAFFQAVRTWLAKSDPTKEKSDEDTEHAIRQIVSRAVSSDEVIDIFAAAGLKKPDISILSDQFLAEVRDMPHKNLAVEVLRKLLNNEIKIRSKRNVVQGRSFAELLQKAIIKYQNRAIEAAAVIEEMIDLAKRMREADARGENLGMTPDEIAFYDALEVNDSAVKVMGEPALRLIAAELVDAVRRNTTIDWTVRENIRANIRVVVKRILRKHGYPPDLEAKATDTVLAQAEVLAHLWAA